MKSRLLLLMLAALAWSCSKQDGEGTVDLQIGYEINGKPLAVDTLCYCNAAGNTFMITEIQWFLSNIALLDESGVWQLLGQRHADDSLSMMTRHIFYLDTDIAESQWLRSAGIPSGRYTALRFTFGLDEYDNKSGMFNNPPESEMFWPDLLGGGYHYMKMNGKFIDNAGRPAPLAVHLGIGQNEDFTVFYHNYFVVELPIDFNVEANAENRLALTMVIDNWFRGLHTLDFNSFAGGIMQDQTAQQRLKDNGGNVFKTT